MFGFKKNLKRETFLKIVDSNKIWLKKLDINEISILLKQIKKELEKYKFKYDNNFVVNARRDGLKTMIEERLKSSSTYEEDIKESLFNFWEFVNDEYDGSFRLASELTNIPIRELDKMSSKYRKKGIICSQEKEMILDMIETIEQHIKEKKN